MKNNRAFYITLIAVVAIFFGAIMFVPQLAKKPGGEEEEYIPTEVDITQYDTTSIIDANSDNGGIADHVKGDPKKAKVILYEYADYQCSACALFNKWIKKLLAEYGDDVAVVFRLFPITSIHPNAIAAGSAVEAAGLQGYWEEYADLVFTNQAEWFYAKAEKRTDYFVQYFKDVTNGEGDVEKFKSDLASDAVKAKVNFDRAVAESYGLTATPSFVGSDGQEIDFITDVEQTETGILNYLRSYINERLGK